MRNRSFRPRLEVMDYRITPSDLAAVSIVAQTATPPASAFAMDEPGMDFSGNTPVGEVPYFTDPIGFPTPACPQPVYWSP